MKSTITGAKSGRSTDQPKSSGVSQEAWLSAFGEDGVDDQSAMTAKELAVLLGCSQQSAYHRAQKLVRLGKATITRKRLSKDRYGGKGWAQAYRLL